MDSGPKRRPLNVPSSMYEKKKEKSVWERIKDQFSGAQASEPFGGSRPEDWQKMKPRK